VNTVEDSIRNIHKDTEYNALNHISESGEFELSVMVGANTPPVDLLSP